MNSNLMDSKLTSETIEVTIFGKRYPILAVKDEEYIKKLASIVDQKMKEVANKAPGLSSASVAVLACLNVVDEFLNYKDSLSQELKQVDEKVIFLVKEINEKLGSSKP